MREDLLGRDIRVTTVDAGLVETEFSVVRFRGDTEQAESVYAGTRPLSAEDVADCVLFALTRPAHVVVDELVVMSIDQSSGSRIHRRDV
jgi:NADP-dependent 3-hydroxy acid dehydrogenase YdfG